MTKRSLLLRMAGLLLLAAVFGVLFATAYREQELWKVVETNGSATTVVGQQRWFGFTGIHLARRERDGAGSLTSAAIVGHAESWSDAKAKANALHRQAYWSDSQLYFEENIRPLVAVTAQATALVAYEGLPHQHFERELLASELKRRESITLGNFPFYARPVPIRPGDVKQLLALCSTESSFERLKGRKGCGGFHPDWCLQWSGPQGECRVLVCFGCGEARVSCGGEGELWTDLETAGRQAFVDLLKPYRTNRPER